MRDEQQQETHIFKKWLMAGITGGIVGTLAGWYIGMFIASAMGLSGFLAMIGAVIGAIIVISIAHGIIIRSWLERGLWWAPLSIAGALILAALLALSVLLELEAMNIALLLLWHPLTGLITGIFQWLLMRHSLPGAKVWIPVSVMGWTFAAIAGYTAAMQLLENSILAGLLVAGIVPALIYSAATGYILERLIRLNQQQMVEHQTVGS